MNYCVRVCVWVPDQRPANKRVRVGYVWAECVGVSVRGHSSPRMLDDGLRDEPMKLPETFWIMTRSRRLFGFPSAESCGFKGQRKHSRFAFWLKIPLF